MKRFEKHSLRPPTIVNIRVATTAEVNDGTGMHDIAAFPRLRHTRAATAARVATTKEIRRRRMPAWLQQGANTRAATAACVLHRIETQLNLRNNMPKPINQKTSKSSSEMASQKCATRELQQLRAPQHLRNAKVTLNTRAATAAHVEPPAQAA